MTTFTRRTVISASAGASLVLATAADASPAEAAEPATIRAYLLADAPGFEALIQARIARPKPRTGEVLVRVRAVSLNYRDVGTVLRKWGPLPVGLVPVSDGAGEVVAIGEGVTRFDVGDRVVGAFMPAWVDGDLDAPKFASSLGGGDAPGVLAEEVVLPETGLLPIPEHLSFQEAACYPCAGLTAWYAIFGAAALKPGDTVLLLGTGGVSTFALQFAKSAGLRAIVTSSSDDKLERAKALGAFAGINYRKQPEWQAEVLRLTGGRGVDHAVEVGGVGTINRTLEAIRYSGSMALMGALTGLVNNVNIGLIQARNIRIHGTYVGSVRMFEAMNKALSASGMRPIIDKVFPFDQARQAFAHLESGSHVGKVVIDIG